MKIAVINETSSADKNSEIIKALKTAFSITPRLVDAEVVNLGMIKSGATPELTYINTALISAIVINAKVVDLVVGGCGTGQGYLNTVMQFPNVVCGHLLSPLDSCLFRQINDGNCISLALNQGYGWAGDINLQMLFEKFFAFEGGGGYPPARCDSQRQSRKYLEEITNCTHQSFINIINNLSDAVLLPAISYPGVFEFISKNSQDKELISIISKRLK